MAFNNKDDVFVVPRRDTGVVRGAASEEAHYDVYEDTKAALDIHHEKVLRSLPHTENVRSEHFTLKIKANSKNGYRYLEYGMYSGGVTRALGGRIGPLTVKKYEKKS